MLIPLAYDTPCCEAPPTDMIRRTQKAAGGPYPSSVAGVLHPKHLTHRWCQIFTEPIILGKRGLAMVIVAGRALLIAAEHLVRHRTRHDTVSITGQQLDAHAQHYPKEGSSRSGTRQRLLEGNHSQRQPIRGILRSSRRQHQKSNS